MTHTVEPTNPSQPADTVGMGWAHAELRALKQRINDLQTALEAADSSLSSSLSTVSSDLDTEEATNLSHRNNTANPHSVTASQVGLGNVDNTSDANKPVSTAQAAAIAVKQDNLVASVSGYVQCLEYFITSTELKTTEFIMTTEGSWQEVGPTGAGNVWAELNNLPTDTKFIDVIVRLSHGGTQRYKHIQLGIRRDGSTNTDWYSIQRAGIRVDHGSGEESTVLEYYVPVRIPVDSRKFEMLVDDVNNNNSYVDCYLSLLGFGR